MLALELAALIGLAACGGTPATTPPAEAEPTPSTQGTSASPTATASPTPEATASPAIEAPEEGRMVQALVNDLRIRREPATDAETIGALHFGQQAATTGESQEVDGRVWLEVRQEPIGISGWVVATDADGSTWLAEVDDGVLAVVAPGPDADVLLVDPGGEDVRQATEGVTITDVAFAPDGRQLAVLDPFRGPIVLNPEDGGTTPTPTPAPADPQLGPPAMTGLAWSADGGALVYLVGQNFLQVTLASATGATPPTIGELTTLFPVSWSPDGQWLAASQIIGGTETEAGDWEIVRLRVGGTDVEALTADLAAGVSPAWSPDGSAIAYLGADDPLTSTLLVMDESGGDPRPLLTFDGAAESLAAPSWSPDGTRIAVAQQMTGSPAAIHLVDVLGGGHTTVTVSDHESCGDLTWSPTGRRIAAVCGVPADQPPRDVVIASADGREAERLIAGTRVDWARELRVSP